MERKYSSSRHPNYEVSLIFMVQTHTKYTISTMVSTYHPFTFCYEQRKPHDLGKWSATFVAMHPPPVVRRDILDYKNRITSSAELHWKQRVHMYGPSQWQQLHRPTSPFSFSRGVSGNQKVPLTYFYLYSNAARTVAKAFSTS